MAIRHAKNTDAKLTQLLYQDNPGTDSAELLAAVVKSWGGVDRLAGDMFQEFKTAKPGSIVRSRIMEAVQRLIINNTNAGLSDVRQPSDMTNGELEGKAMELLKKIKEAEPDAEQQEDGPPNQP
jgi:hypothetical protein